MNHCVPDFKTEDDLSIPTSSGLSRNKKSTHHEDELMELLWQNGQVVMQSQNPRSLKKSPLEFPIEDAVLPARQSRKISSSEEEATASQLFMQEDEMTSWLHYPLDASFEQDFCADLLYPAPSGNYAPPGRSNQIPDNHRVDKPPVDSRPPIPPARTTELNSSGKLAKGDSRPSTWDKSRKSTVVDSRDSPAEVTGPRVFDGGRSTATVSGGSMNDDAAAADGVRESGTCEPVGTSSSGGSASAEALLMPPAENRKRKGREAEDNEGHSEDAEFESADAKKQVRGSTSARRARAAEVHNLSERRRRDRINEKMKALQELIPRCNKSDKASMLDEAIEYLKSLQLQVQMMSMGCGMVPMMFPGVQQYMPPMGMGMRMGMDMGLSRPMLPFPSVLAGSTMPTPPTAAHFGQRLPIPAFHRPPVPTADLLRIQPTNQSDSVLNSIGTQSPNQPWVPNFADPYQQYLTLHQMQIPPPQNQAIAQPSTSKGVEALESHKSG